MKDKRINWVKINIITYSGEFMTDEAKAEYKKALIIYNDEIIKGNIKKARYILRRIREKKNYVEG